MNRSALLPVLALFALATPVLAGGKFLADYPPKALREHREGTTYLTVRVGADGQAMDCMVTKSSGSADLDEAACQMALKRFIFKPATDEKGTPIEALYSTKVDWRIPE